MSVEQYANEIIVVTSGESPSGHKIWLRVETPDDLVGDLRWLQEEYLDAHVIVDLSHIESFVSTCFRLMLDLQKLASESDYRLVLCGLSEHLKWQLGCVHLLDEFVTFDSREAAIKELLPVDEDQ